MQKTLIIALREYRSMVATKAFLASLIIMPILMFGGIFAMSMVQRLTASEDLKVAVWDPSGKYMDLLTKSAEERNRMIRLVRDQSAAQAESLKGLENPDEDKGSPIADIDMILIQSIDKEQLTDQDRLDFSDLIRSKDLHAFIEIPDGIGDLGAVVPVEGILANADPSPAAKVLYYSSASGLSPTKRWFVQTLAAIVKSNRLDSLQIDPMKVELASIQVPVKSMDLMTVGSDGQIVSTEAKDTLTALLMPMGCMMMMVMVIFLSAQPMLESVLEEKSQRIAEVLLGSCNPMQLMSGKLIGTVAGSLTIFVFYSLGGYVFAANQDALSMIPFSILPWFCVFQVCGVLFYSSIFMAIGSSVSQLKEAQSMLMPVWMIMMVPMMTWFILVQKPDGAMAFWLSMFPPTTPTVMVLRIATGTVVPLWQIICSLIILTGTTVFCVYLAGRIFRIGILWQGKAPKITQLLSWALFK